MDEYTRKKLEGTNKRSADAPLDPLTGALPMLSDFDRDIHAGHGWELSHIVENVVAGGEVLLQLNTGAAGLRMRKVMIWGDASLARLELLRNPDCVDGTTAVPIFNLDHTSKRELPDGIEAFSDPTDVEMGDGACYRESLIGGGEEIALASKAWASDQGVDTMLLPDTTYILRITNLNGDARNFSIRMLFCA